MLNITLTAAPELLATISNITSALKYQNDRNVKGYDSDYRSSKIHSEHNFQQASNVQNAPRQNIETAAKTGQYVQTNAQVVPTTVQSCTMEQLAVTATQIVDEGRRAYGK